MGEWFASVAESFSKAFLVSGRYMAYLNGFKTTLILSFFAVIVGVMLGLILGDTPGKCRWHLSYHICNLICRAGGRAFEATKIKVPQCLYFVPFSIPIASPRESNAVRICFEHRVGIL